MARGGSPHGGPREGHGRAAETAIRHLHTVSPSLAPSSWPRNPSRSTQPHLHPTDWLGGLGHIDGLSFPTCTMSSYRDAPMVPLAVTPPATEGGPSPTSGTHLLTRPGPPSPNPPSLTFAPAPAPLLQLSPRQAEPVGSQLRSRKGPRPGTLGMKGPADPVFPGSGQVPHLTHGPRRGKQAERRKPVPVQPAPSQAGPEQASARSTGEGRHSHRRPEHDTNTCPSWDGTMIPSVCMCVCLPESKKKKGPRKPRDYQPLPEGLPCHPTSTWGDPRLPEQVLGAEVAPHGQE